MTDDFKQRILDIPGAVYGPFENDGEDYLELAEKLLAKGFTEDEAEDLLSKAYRIAANRFGA